MYITTMPGRFKKAIDCSGFTAVVKLNGKRVYGCHTVDDVKGKVIVYRKDKNGNFILDKYKKYVVCKTLYGKVEIEFPNPALREIFEKPARYIAK